MAGPYIRRIFQGELGLDDSSCLHADAKEDFGGLHPDPNLVHAKSLVDKMYGLDPNDTAKYDLGVAFDGDMDRNMIVGHKFFVNPSDSLAVITANARCIPFYASGLVGVARSMPTSAAVDVVAKKLGIPCYVTPTGWKFFGNLMDKYEAEGSSCFICGEESFGTSSAHIREKDGLWASLAWLSILAANPGKSVKVIVEDHWREFGRVFYSRHDYEECDVDQANAVFEHLQKKVANPPEQVVRSYNFSYTDPVDNTVTGNQGLCFELADGARIVFRLSGTGSVGATIRVYMEKIESNPEMFSRDPQVALKSLIELYHSLSDMERLIGRTTPTVIT